MSIKTRVGRVIEVKNQNKKKSANDVYHSVLMKLSNGEVHEFLFTQIELDVAHVRARKNLEDNVQQSLISKILD
jgi:hypothetical protein